mgnify:CR=1 FL=1
MNLCVAEQATLFTKLPWSILEHGFGGTFTQILVEAMAEKKEVKVLLNSVVTIKSLWPIEAHCN